MQKIRDLETLINGISPSNSSLKCSGNPRKRRQSVRASGDGARHTGKPYKSAWEHSYEIIENKVAWTMPPLVAEKEWYNQEEDNNTNIMVEEMNKN